MNADSETAILINDLDSLVYRIEALQAHPEYTSALCAVQEAKAAMMRGRADIHAVRMRERFGSS